MRFRNFALIVSLVSLAACLKQDQTVITGLGGGEGTTRVAVTPFAVDKKFGTCEVPTFLLTANMPVFWTVDNSGVVAVSGSSTTATTTVTVTIKKAGSGKVIATDPKNSTNKYETPVTSTACPPDGGGGTDYSNISIVLTPTGSCNLIVGQSFKLTPVFTPSSTPSGGSWLSSASNVAPVDQGGNIIAASAGNTVITFTSTVNPAKKATMTCTVTAATGGGGKSLTYTPSTGSGYPGTSLQLVAHVSGTTDLRVQCFSTDPSRVAIGLNTCLITFVYPGPAIQCMQLVVDPNVKYCGTAAFTTLGNAIVGDILTNAMLGAMYNAMLASPGYRFPNIEMFPKGDGHGGYVGRHNIE